MTTTRDTLARNLDDLPEPTEAAPPNHHRGGPVTPTSRLPRCEIHDLERLWCPDDCPLYGQGFTMTPAEYALVNHAGGGVHHVTTLEAVAGRTLHEVRFTTRHEPWLQPDPKATRCDDTHQRPPGAQLCPACDTLLDQLLGDVPALVDDLQTAIRKDVRFPRIGRPHERSLDAEGNPIDESPLPFNLGASRILSDLARVLHGPPIARSRWALGHPRETQRAALLADLSRLVERAHQIIDRPADLVYVGPCPTCTRDLETPRGHDVACEHCTYRQAWQTHIDTMLAGRLDTLMTVAELVVATGFDRGHVKNLTRRMAGVEITRPHLDGWMIRTRSVTMYKLGDVLAEHERRDTTRPHAG